ncbi:MAG: DegT/DnrJ/EryC1/StrS family aminotransferase [Chloroflexi bacterium]|nr:DegT/DnrJ/EryC1/StrS family aminotransferase [Chloroflexota bacterium]
MTIPLTRPLMEADEEQEVLDVLRSGAIGTGPKTVQFEREFASYIGRKHAVGTDSCTNALHLALRAVGVGEGDEVITTPMTFVATANSIVYTGAKPIFVDVEPDTLNIDPARIAAAVTERTRAIVLVHLYGHPCEMDQILDIAKRYGLKVVSDCAHAIEAEYRGMKAGALGDVSCYSFYATKNLATGNGGMLVTDDDQVAELVTVLRDHGMSAGAWNRYQTGESKHYAMTHLGYKCIMWDLQAALGLAQLKKIEARHARRVKLAALYHSLLAPLEPYVEPLHPRSHVKHAHHLFPVMLHGMDRDWVAAQSEASGIGVGVHYRPVHLEPFYRKEYGHSPGEFPVAEGAGEGLLSLPFWPEMEESHVVRVAKTLQEVLDGHRKENGASQGNWTGQAMLPEASAP